MPYIRGYSGKGVIFDFKAFNLFHGEIFKKEIKIKSRGKIEENE